jgi:hypothetical protein
MPAMLQTPYEAGRLFAGDYAGKKARLCLATTTGGSPGLSSNTAAWDAVELTGNGYARCEWTIPAGSFNSTADRFEAGSQSCQFIATGGGAGLSWNAAYLVIGTIGGGGAVTWNTGVSFVLTESPNIVLSPGEPRSYNVLLFTDGFLVAA